MCIRDSQQAAAVVQEQRRAAAGAQLGCQPESVRSRGGSLRPNAVDAPAAADVPGIRDQAEAAALSWGAESPEGAAARGRSFAPRKDQHRLSQLGHGRYVLSLIHISEPTR